MVVNTRAFAAAVAKVALHHHIGQRDIRGGLHIDPGTFATFACLYGQARQIDDSAA